MDNVDLYSMILYICCYFIVIFEFIMFCFADVAVLPNASDPQVCSIIVCDL